MPARPADRQLTFAPHGHVLTNANAWSPDGRRIVYDVRSDADGSTFDGGRIETVDADTGEVRVLYESRRGACCGVATYHPRADRIVFILGPEHPTPDWAYGPDRRQGVTVDEARPGVAAPLDARDLVPPFTPGALRGGSHVHVFSPDGALVSFTYDDHVLSSPDGRPGVGRDAARRNVGVAVVGRAVAVPRAHPRNHDGSAFCALVTHTTAVPTPGSDEYGRAYEEGWVGTGGYVRADGTRQRRALAFLGDVVTPAGRTIAEVFVADLPDDPTTPGDGPLAGTKAELPHPPAGVSVRRLTRTADRRFPGVQGPRHWLRSAPDGSRVAFLMRDDAGVAQLWTVSPADGNLTQLTRGPRGVASAFTWSPDGRGLAHATDGSVCLTDAATGRTRRLTPRPADAADAPLPLAAVFGPDGQRVAYLRRVRHPADGRRYNQVFAVAVGPDVG